MTLDKISPTKEDDLRIEMIKRKQVEYSLVGSQKKVDGHILFEYDPSTGIIRQAEITYCDTLDFFTRKPLFNPKVHTKKGCIYRQALNKKNVIKRLKKEGYTKFK